MPADSACPAWRAWAQRGLEALDSLTVAVAVRIARTVSIGGNARDARITPQQQSQAEVGFTSDFDAEFVQSTEGSPGRVDIGRKGDSMTITPEHILAVATLISAIAGLVWSLRRSR